MITDFHEFHEQSFEHCLGSLAGIMVKAGWLDRGGGRNSSLFSCLHVHFRRYLRTFRVADGGVDGFCM